MSEHDNGNDGSLVPAGRRDLAPVGGANPLVSRAIEDLAQFRFPNALPVPSLHPQDPAFYYTRGLAQLDEFEYEKAIEDRAGPQKLDSRLSYSRLPGEGVSDGAQAEVAHGGIQGPGGRRRGPG